MLHLNEFDTLAKDAAIYPKFSPEISQYAPEQTLRTIISWGRYAEVFAYDDHRQAFSLENPA